MLVVGSLAARVVAWLMPKFWSAGHTMKSIKFMRSTAAACIAAFAAMSGAANAHSISIGYENAGPGAVSIFLGTYSVGHAADTLEGSLTLQGVLGTAFGPSTLAFDILIPSGPGGTVGSKPAGLIDGVTNFYIPGITDPDAALVGSEAGFNASCPACGPVTHWQGVTFTGLLSGDYQFTWIPIANPTAQWDIINNNMNGVFSLSGSVVNGDGTTPLPAALPLFASGIGGLGLLSWRKRRKAAAIAAA
jgi:fibronectin-binding autotransporter adhesin